MIFLRGHFGIVLGGVNYLSVGLFGCIWMDQWVDEMVAGLLGCVIIFAYIGFLSCYFYLCLCWEVWEVWEEVLVDGKLFDIAIATTIGRTKK